MKRNIEKQEMIGLTQEEVLQSRIEHGLNLLTPPKKISAWVLFLKKFKDPIIQILVLAAFLSLIISIIENQYAETIGIIIAILAATGISFIFEYNAKRRFEILNTVNDESTIKAMRKGQICEIPRKDVVVNDIIILEAGDEVPADGILIKSTSMQVNESTLTGELIVDKTIDKDKFDKEATYSSNKVMRSTTIIEGYGMMRVTEVGDNTEIGDVAKQSTENAKIETPLNIQLTRFAKLISKVGFSIAGVVFAIFVLRDLYAYISSNQFLGWKQYIEISAIILKYFMMAVTLIVVAVPEGLPMSITLSLALNMRRMLRTNNLVRSMHACETMGAINVICTDKTGTITQNKMQVQSTFFNGMENIELKNGDNTCSALIAESISANTTAFLEITDQIRGVGNPTEAALLIWLHDQNINYMEIRKSISILNEITFSTERKYMAVYVKSALFPGKQVLYVKGAPEILLNKCSNILIEDKQLPIECYKQNIGKWLEQAQNKAMRTLAFAYKIVDEFNEDIDCQTLLKKNDLTYMGMVSIADPIRVDIKEAINECKCAGIDVKIVTGDTQVTATEIARQIGLWETSDSEENKITGPAFGALNDDEALKRIKDLKIMSRARPSDKQRLVELLQKNGAVVAVTGDGTNDAPALNYAQVGLSMGSGTSVAKQASDITLLDDSFTSITTAVMWGRSLYKNIQRFIVFQLTINLVALFMELVGAFMNMPLPLTVTQMLWINLIMDTFAAMAMSSIPPSKDVMQQRPRGINDFIINKSMIYNIIITGIAFILVLIGTLTYYNYTDNGNITTYHLTIFFTTFVMLQFWNLINMRVFDTNKSIFKELSKSYGLLLVLGIIFIGQFFIVEFGDNVFRTESLTWQMWLKIIGTTSFILWIEELIRLYKRKKQQKND